MNTQNDKQDKAGFDCESCGIHTDWIHPVNGMCEMCCLEEDAYNDIED